MGNLYVADAAAQRIRIIRKNGFVVTLAGSGDVNRSGLFVSPGFRDGPAHQARFFRPSGIAVTKSGVYVADTYNHCIRLISEGVVSTFAGICGVLGAKDGTRGEATLSYPRQLDMAADGTLYVADYMNAVRRISPLGAISTLPLPIDKRVTGLVLQKGTNNLVVADVGGLLFYDLRTAQTKRIPSYYASHVFPPPIAGGLELGSPYALADSGNGGAGIFYTDLRTDSVRYLTATGFMEYLAGPPRDDAVLGDGSEGALNASSLHGPMGIARDTSGNVFVADSGHKRIMEIRDFDVSRGFLGVSDLLSLQRKRAEYRILIIGNSFVWFTAKARDSIGGHLEEKLRSEPSLAATGRAPKVLSLITTSGIEGQASLAREVISNSSVDFVLIFANSFDMGQYLPAQDWKERFHQQEAQTVAALKAASLNSMFVVVPDNVEATPLEQLYQHENLQTVTDADYAFVEPILLKELEDLGRPVLNLYPTVRAYEAGAYLRPLYANEDLHPSSFGRVFFADQIAKRLKQLRPWDELRK
ncbi:MAG: hypothetical protein JO233_08220 [Candidatus Eremiobacteraeota bacterium]|nr:hypothetical protein [Candidatus Eremiobacteraeota bacterium]